ncbi:MAG: YncE family protein [Betaproteobacteria bacterium]
MRRLMAVAAIVAGSALGLQAQDPGYHFVRQIPIPGDTGWDYLAVNAPTHRLYVSHGVQVVVIDTKTDKIVGTLEDTPGVHGVAFADDLGRGYTSNGRENTSTIFDLKTLKPIRKVQTEGNPDAILYEPGRHEVYTFNGRGQSATVFDAKSGNVVATVPLGGKPETGAADPAAGKVYVNIEDKNEIKVIDTGTHAVTATWPIAPGESASGMAIDVAHHRLFIGCHNRLMLMIDSTTGKVVGQVPIGAGVDSNWYDSGTMLAYSSNGEGNVTVAHEDSPDKLTVVQTVTTTRGARTMALDPSSHTIYLSAADYEPQAPGATGRPRMKPGTFRVLVYAMGGTTR